MREITIRVELLYEDAELVNAPAIYRQGHFVLLTCRGDDERTDQDALLLRLLLAGHKLQRMIQ